MNELIKIKTTEFQGEQIDNMNSHEIILFILNDIVRLSYEGKDAKKVLSIFNDMKPCFPSKYDYLVDAVLYQLLWAKRCYQESERDIQNKFFDNLEKYLPGAVKVDVKMDRFHVPDGFVQYNGNIFPVEVKRDAIVNDSIRQINRYINEYSSVGGIVVAPKLSAPLPSNVIYVEVKKENNAV